MIIRTWLVWDQGSVMWLHMRLGAHPIHLQSWHTIQKTNSQVSLQLHFIVLIWWSLWFICLTDIDWQMTLTAATKGDSWAVIGDVRRDVWLFLTCGRTGTYLNWIILVFGILLWLLVWILQTDPPIHLVYILFQYVNVIFLFKHILLVHLP